MTKLKWFSDGTRTGFTTAQKYYGSYWVCSDSRYCDFLAYHCVSGHVPHLIGRADEVGDAKRICEDYHKRMS